MPAPIVICGHRAEMADKVMSRMAPEYETIHVVLTADSGATELPALLLGSSPASTETESGATHNYAAPPVAILLSATYTDDDINRMREACAHVKPGVPWMRPDIAKMRREQTENSPKLGSDEHATFMCEKMKSAFVNLEKEHKMNEDSVVWF